MTFRTRRVTRPRSSRPASGIRACEPDSCGVAGLSLSWLLLDALMKPHKHNQYNVSGNDYYPRYRQL
jgi:hypothetical protein